LHENFETYAAEITDLADEYADCLIVLRGFEAEAVPHGSYAGTMLALREKYRLDYMAGSVHHVHDLIIDGPPALYAKAIEISGSVERLAIDYYSNVATMVRAIRPEVVTHLDLIRRNAPTPESVETPAVREAALAALEAVRENNAILDLNTAGIRKGLGCPYPRPWLIREAHRRGIPFCFGDDSHGPAQVGKDVPAARDYLLANGVDTISFVTREHGRIVRKTVPLAD
jgi:histidinol-phosphatase (PHP family)